VISDILLYEIRLQQKVPFLFFFKKRQDIIYQLHYKVDEDRCNFKKTVGKEVISNHHTKNNIENSLKILEGIKKRIEFLQEISQYNYTIFDLRDSNSSLFNMVDLIGKDVNRIKQKEEPARPKVHGMILQSK
jgi:hypothetical protein